MESTNQNPAQAQDHMATVTDHQSETDDLQPSAKPLNDQETLSSHTTESFDSDIDRNKKEQDKPQKIGEKENVTFDGKVKKEILQIGEGLDTPTRSSLVTLTYKMTFADGTVLEQKEEPFVISLGDPLYPEGYWKGVEKMRKNEIAKIYIKKGNYSFAKKANQDKIKFPQGYEEGPSREQLLSKQLIYEVKLHDWIERHDIEGEGNLMKTFVRKADKKEFEKPKELDEVTISLKLFQNSSEEVEQPAVPLFQNESWQFSMNDEKVSQTLRKILESTKQGEQSKVNVRYSYLTQVEDQLFFKMLEGTGEVKPDQDFTVEIELLKLIKVHDLLKDQTTFKKILTRGKGSCPQTDSTVKILMRIVVDGAEIVNCYTEDDGDHTVEATEIEKRCLTFKLDNYILPALIMKVVKSMKKGEVCEVTTTNIPKLRTYFPSSPILDQYAAFPEGTSKVQMKFTLVDFEKGKSFYALPIKEKYAYVLEHKGVANNFFKVSNFLKASKIYKKIQNACFQYNDHKTNDAKEDENSADYQSAIKELEVLRNTLLVNNVVCKFKQKKFKGVLKLTDKILELDPSNVKALFFRGKVLLEQKEFDQSIECFHKLCQVDPSHTEGRNELARAKKAKKDFLEEQHKKYSKLFSK